MLDILVVEDTRELQNAIKLALNDYANCKTKFADSLSEAFKMLDSQNFDIVLSDKKLPDGDGLQLLSYVKDINPDICFILMTAFPESEHIKEAIEKGAFHYLTKPFKKYELDIVLRLSMQNIKLKKQVRYYKEKEIDIEKEYLLDGGTIFKQLLDNIKKISKTNANCLITGESGVGKEVVANLIHKFSSRVDNPFVVVNCPAVTANLFESELFGHEKGSFTGANSRKLGKFELANSGTILLDEITEIPIDLQSKLLRVIQDKVIERVGSVKPIYIDVTIIATTNRDIQSFVKSGKFREDLFHRLNVVRIEVPPLRARIDDIENLLMFFSKKFSTKCRAKAKIFTQEAITLLKSYHWYGNIRELANFVERIYVLENEIQITDNIVKKYIQWEHHINLENDSSTAIGSTNLFNHDLNLPPHMADVDRHSRHGSWSYRHDATDNVVPPHISNTANDHTNTAVGSTDYQLPTINIKSLEKIAIQTALKMFNNNKSKAARSLGITERTLRNKLKTWAT